MTPEHERAIAQAERNAAEAAYFDSDEHKYGPRPNQRPTFRAGFNAGWDRRDAVGVNRSAEIARLTAEIERLRAQVKRLRDALVGMVEDDEVNGLRFTAAVLGSMDCDDATVLLAAVRVLIDIRPEGSAGEGKR